MVGIFKTVMADPNAEELYTYHHLRVRPATGNLLVPAVDVAPSGLSISSSASDGNEASCSSDTCDSGSDSSFSLLSCGALESSRPAAESVVLVACRLDQHISFQ